MHVTVNGEAHEIPEALTVRGLVEHLALTGGPVAVEVNQDVVIRAEHTARVLTEGDVIEIVHFVGGG